MRLDSYRNQQLTMTLRPQTARQRSRDSDIAGPPLSNLKRLSGLLDRSSLRHLMPKPPEMITDRDPDTGLRFPTVTAMREKKLRDWAAGAARLPFTHHVACRDYLLDAA